MMKIKIKFLRNFFMDRYIKKLRIGSSTFVQQDFMDFITSPGNDHSLLLYPLALLMLHVHTDVQPDGYYPSAVPTDKCTKVHNKAVDLADKTTADPVSTQIDSNVTMTEDSTSDVENGPTIDTSSYGSLNTTGRSKDRK